MTNEDFERTKEFILKQQAQVAVKIQRLEESILGVQESQRRMQESERRMQESQGDMQKSQVFITENIARAADTLARATILTEALAQSPVLTDEKLRNLNAKVDRHVGDRHSHEN